MVLFRSNNSKNEDTLVSIINQIMLIYMNIYIYIYIYIAICL